MKRPKLLAFCLLVFWFFGGAPKSRPMARPQYPEAERFNRVAALRAAINHGGELYRARQYQQASQVFQSIFQQAASLSSFREEGRALGNLGGCQFALHQYKAALRSFLEASRVSALAGDTASVAGWDANIAALYYQTGEVNAAAEWTARSLARMSGPDRREQLPKLQIEMATLRSVQGRMNEARTLFRQGISGADRAGDWDLYANAWNRLGEALLAHGDLADAEAALLEAYRTRKLRHLALETSYRSLGQLRLAQGDIPSASVLLDRAVDAARQPRGWPPDWDTYYTRALVRMAQGRMQGALADLRIAQRLGRAWRWSSPANESLQIGAEEKLDQVHSALVDVGNRLYLETRNSSLKQETFTANEENRAVSLRDLFGASQDGTVSSDLPGPYWEALTRLQHAEVAALQRGDTSDLASARADLVRVEASLGGEFRPLPRNLIEATRRKLDPGTALFSFHLGNTVSWVWALDREGLEVYPLPDRATLEAQARRVTQAIRGDQPDAAAISENFYRTIFGSVATRFRNAPRWLLELDGAMFDVPFPALVERSDPAAEYVVQRHTVESIPGVAYWLESGERPMAPFSPLFIGVGDPIYNRADTRGAGISYGASQGLVLPRLVGSGSEIEACARAWRGQSVLLRGRGATREKLIEQLRQHPAAVHLATHYVESAGATRYSLIALSLSPEGDTEILSPPEISAWRINAGLVVLSGCHSSAGAALPGEGVLGLTRAWLAAGAHAVLGSRWDTPDNDGALFGEFYRQLQAMGRLDAGEALRQAQLRTIQAGGRFSHPSYWGTYFVVTNQGTPRIPRPLGGEEK